MKHIKIEQVRRLRRLVSMKMYLMPRGHSITIITLNADIDDLNLKLRLKDQVKEYVNLLSATNCWMHVETAGHDQQLIIAPAKESKGFLVKICSLTTFLDVH